jgi:molybdopterin/thiamine biosynthesis adenylyltransferase
VAINLLTDKTFIRILPPHIRKFLSNSEEHMKNTAQEERAGDPDRREPIGGVCLEDHAYPIDYLGGSQLVIEDADLLRWAESSGISPRSAQIEALQCKIIPLRYAKNFRALTLAEQRKLCEGRVLICGGGGIGGVLVNLLARAGVGTLRLVDGGVFVSSNLNRQWFCDTHALSRPKAEVAGECVRAINPLIEVEVFPTLMDENNAGSFIEGVDLVMDTLDILTGSFLLAEAAKHVQVPFIHAAANGWWGQISTFLPGSFFDLHDVYGQETEQDPAVSMMGALGPAPAVIGSLVAFEAIRLLSGRNSAYADHLLYLDGESGRMDVVPLGE